ncbi:MAG: PrsW family glutamic-type intramembrane protease [Polyangiales bacterium]
MKVLLGLAVSVAAVLVILTGVRRLDASRPTPRVVTYATLGLGALACLPAVLIEVAAREALGDARLIGGRFLDAFVVAALVEESLKLAVVLAYSRRKAGVLDVMDGVVYCVAASLGFGLIENAAFAWSDPTTALVRSLTAVPVHAVSTGAMGYFVGRSQFVRRESHVAVLAAGLASAVAIHGLYDWAIFYRGPHWEAQSLTVLGVGALLLVVMLRHAMKMDAAMYGPDALASVEVPWPTNITNTLVPAPPRQPPKPPSAIEPK